MLFMGLCDNADVLKVIRIVKIVINIIKIVVPIILILSVMIDYMKAVKDNDGDALAKTNKLVVSRAIAAMLVFFIPTFVDTIAHISSFDSDSYSSCIENANNEYISEIIENDAKVYLAIAQKSLKNTDYDSAYAQINKVTDEGQKAALLGQLEEVKKAIKEKEEKEKKEKEEREKKAEEERKQGRSGGSSGGSSGDYYGGSTDFTPGVSGNVDNVLGIYYYQQCDSRWGNIEYDIGGGYGANGHATLCSSSCGYTSFAMIAAGLNNDPSINPYSVIKYMRGISDGQLTHRGYGAASWGEIANNDKIRKYNLTCSSVSGSGIENALRSGKPVLILVPGHYMVLSISAAGNIVLLDPFTAWGSKYKKSGEYKKVSDIEHIYGGIQKAYAYSKL